MQGTIIADTTCLIVLEKIGELNSGQLNCLKRHSEPRPRRGEESAFSEVPQRADERGIVQDVILNICGANGGIYVVTVEDQN